jgi:hypothetical protein
VAPLKEVRRPLAGTVGPVVGSGFDEHHLSARVLTRPSCDDAAGCAAADYQHVRLRRHRPSMSRDAKPGVRLLEANESDVSSDSLICTREAAIARSLEPQDGEIGNHFAVEGGLEAKAPTVIRWGTGRIAAGPHGAGRWRLILARRRLG